MGSSTRQCLQAEAEAAEELRQGVSSLRVLVFDAARARGGFLALYVEISELADLLLRVRPCVPVNRGRPRHTMTCMCAGHLA